MLGKEILITHGKNSLETPTTTKLSRWPHG